jgi:flagellar biosynthesis protein FlhG
VAAGKGGVGKTFITANLAVALAELGYQTLVIDLDLGGSNLYSFLGVSNRYPGIGDFLKAKAKNLDSLILPTDIPNLTYLPGDGRTPFMANIANTQKLRLITNLKKLTADYILLDLGSGTSYNTLDFFGLSDHGVIVTTPEYPSIINMLVFLKNYIYRIIDRHVANNHSLQTSLREMFKKPISEQVTSVESLLEIVSKENPAYADSVIKEIKKRRPRVIFNKGETPDELKLSSQISKSLGSNLCIEVDYFGFIFYDRDVRKSIRNRHAYLPHFRDSLAAENILRTAERISRYWKKPVKDSAGLLLKHVQKSYQNRTKPSS